MAPWPGIPSRFINQYRKYKELECITKYKNIHEQILNKIATLNNNPRNFCKRCQALRLNIINENEQLKDCYAPDLLRNKLIDDYEINAFMEKCLEPPNGIYNGASHDKNIPGLKRVPAKASGRRNECNTVATPVKESAGTAQPELNRKSPETKLSVKEEEVNIKQSHTEREESTKANTNSGPHNNTSNPNDPVVVKPGAPLSKGIDPSGTTEHESIPEQPTSASPNSLPRELGNSSEDSSPQVTPESEYSTTDIAQQKNLETSNHESDQHVHQQVNGDSLDEQNIERPTSQNQDTDERSLNVEEAAVRTLSGENPGTEVISNLLEGIADLGGLPRLHNKITDAAAGGEMYVNGVPLEIPVGKPLSDSTTGDNPEIKYKNYTAMALAPTGVIMLMTLLSKYTSLGMLFTKKRRNTRKDIRQNIERILLLESPAKTEESSYSFAYSPSQYWEK
ncbi:PIR protein [Plasmodium vivax]|uniref:VIR protein n=1 Tax=Plasmodium vivax TaxID=5855 RepID=A0A565A440_PLAVI|nr:PIR protein [Plasmodium vivax]